MAQTPFRSWLDVVQAPHSTFFQGHTADSVRDRQTAAQQLRGLALRPFEETLYTQSNAGVLIGHAADGSFRFLALPTSVYPLPTPPCNAPTTFCPGMYYRTDTIMYAGDLAYQLELEGGTPIDLASADRDNTTVYADHFLPLTQTRQGDLEIALTSLAPVSDDPDHAPLAPAPLPGLPGAIYSLHLRNRGATALKGKVRLKAGDLMVRSYEDARPEARNYRRPKVEPNYYLLTLAQSEGAVGLWLAGGDWTQREAAPFCAERAFELAPGAEQTFDTYVAIGPNTAGLVATANRLALRPTLEWINRTAAFWRGRLGRLEVRTPGAGEAGAFSRDVWIRCLVDNFNCLQTDSAGNLLAHWQGAPSHICNVTWGIDVEPTLTSVASFCPELARQGLLFFMTRSQAWAKPPEHSTPIFAAPLIVARRYLELSGDIAFFARRPEVFASLEHIAATLAGMCPSKAALLPSRYSSDGNVGRRYDYGTNVKGWYALAAWAYILEKTGHADQARPYAHLAARIRAAIPRHMSIEGPFGPQISGGTNLGEDPRPLVAGARFQHHYPEGQPYYDGEDSGSALAPIYGFCDFTDERWINYHRFARSLWCQNYDPEHETLRWFPAEGMPLDGTGYLSRLGGAVTRAEMREALDILRRHSVYEPNGSIHWWPLGVNRKTLLTRCSQGQGAWAWQYLQQWLGLQVDATTRTITVAPRGLLTEFAWEDFPLGGSRWDVAWREQAGGPATLTVRNRNACAWTLRAGFRPAGTGATGRITWKIVRMAPGKIVTLAHRAKPAAETDFDTAAVVRREAEHRAGPKGIVFEALGGPGRYELGASDEFVRLLVVNGTAGDLADTRVVLHLPEGWQAEPRRPQHFDLPQAFSAGPAVVELGRLTAWRRAVAPFWVKRPGRPAGTRPETLLAELIARAPDGEERRMRTSVFTVPAAPRPDG